MKIGLYKSKMGLDLLGRLDKKCWYLGEYSKFFLKNIFLMVEVLTWGYSRYIGLKSWVTHIIIIHSIKHGCTFIVIQL
jgi:hypothetical protein